MRFDMRGLVALVLSLGVVATVVILAMETILHSGAISETEANVLSTAVGAIIGSIATFLGVYGGTERPKPPPSDGGNGTPPTE